MSDWFAMTPRHGFVSRDARGWYAGGQSRSRSLPWLLPRTLRGAVCTALGRLQEQQGGGAKTRREWLDLKEVVRLTGALALRVRIDAPEVEVGPQHRMWPAPADSVHADRATPPRRYSFRRMQEGVHFAEDAEHAAMDLDYAAVELAGKPASGPTWWTEAEFLRWLTVAPPLGPLADHPTRTRGPVRRQDVHVKRDATTATAEPGLLWGSEVRETLVRRGLETYCWSAAVRLGLEGPLCGLSASLASATIGGERRLSSMAMLPSSLDAVPAELLAAAEAAKAHRIRVYCTTPAIFGAGWLPDGFRAGRRPEGSIHAALPALRLVGAIVPRPTPVSGWGMQDGQAGAARPTHWAVQPGSVYVFEKVDGSPFTAPELRTLWLRQWGEQQDDGFGLFVAGLDPSVAADQTSFTHNVEVS